MRLDLSSADSHQVASLPLVADLSVAARREVLGATTIGRWDPGDSVISEGATGRELFVVLEGSVRVTMRSAGRDIFLADLGPGELFGEDGLLARGTRGATVTASTNLRCAVVPAAVLDPYLDSDSSLRRSLESLSTRRLHERLVRSVAALQGLELEGTKRGDVSRVSYPAGARIFEHGESSDAVFFVLDGVVAAMREDADRRQVLTRIGPGQCVGEVGVLQGRARSASVLAETPVEALRVEADRFRAWVSDNPRLADYLGTLERIYPLADGRLLTVYRGEHEGREAVSTLAGDPAGECVVSTKVLGEATVLLARGSSQVEGERDVVRYTESEEGRERELLLDGVERGKRREILRARIYGVRVRGIGPDVPGLYLALRDREPIEGKAIRRFHRTGFLGGQTPATDPNSVCTCLGIGRQDICSALIEHGPDVNAVIAVLGVGVVCGACLPRAREIAGGSAHRVDPSAVQAAGTRVESKLVARQPLIEFDEDTVLSLSAEPEVHAVAVASVFAAGSERFMTERVREALPILEDPRLVADAEVFLEQESLHIATHEPLNRLFLERIYPRSRTLRRCAKGVLGGAEKLPLRVTLAASAAFEYLADGLFAAMLEEYYRRGRRCSQEPAIHELMERSGIAPLFLWHGGEELYHRHVVFDVMLASGAGWFSRFAGFGLCGLHVVLRLIPALLALRVHTFRRTRPVPHRRPDFGFKQNLRVGLRTFRFLRPGFHPADESYPFEVELASDLEKFPQA